MSRRLIGFAAALLCSIPLVASAALSKVNATVTLDAELSPVGSFEAKSNKLSVSEDGNNLKFSVPVNSVDTGIGMRNKEMMERFGKGSAVLTVPKDQIKFPSAGKKTSGSVKGTFDLNGATSNVTVSYSAEVDKDGNDVIDASFKFSYLQHHVDPDKGRGAEACKLGVCVEKMLTVKMEDGKFKH